MVNASLSDKFEQIDARKCLDCDSLAACIWEKKIDSSML
jgi:hypothetical protein